MQETINILVPFDHNFDDNDDAQPRTNLNIQKQKIPDAIGISAF
jgi:hypothetical protein